MYNKGRKGWFKHIDFILLDIICLQISLILAYKIRENSFFPYATKIYFDMAIVISLIDLLISIFFETYNGVLRRGYYQELKQTFKHALGFTMAASVYLVSTKSAEEYSRIVLGLTAVLYVLISYIVRILWKKFIVSRNLGKKKRALIVVTVSELVDEVLENMKKYEYGGFQVTGLVLFDKPSRGKSIKGIPVVADADTVVDYVCHEWVDEVFVNIPHSHAYPEKMIDQFTQMGVVVHLKIADFYCKSGQKQIVENLGDYTVLTSSLNMANPRQLLLKRTMDICGGLVGCVITGILYLILAPMIKKQSPGPVFFKQKRIGENGRVFEMYKFRSMVMNAEALKKELMEQNRVSDGMMFKLEFDPRIIGCKKLPDGTIKKGIGNFIRDWSIDEFPQFLNVLKGEMSLVGTRPPTLDEWEKYDLKHRARMAIKPGVTGMWQVSGRSDITDFEEVVKLDTQYINTWSIGHDIRILFQTIKVVLGKDGAM